MLNVSSPVIQVVTTGTDWPAIVAVISTGIVGLAGIGTTLWQVMHNWQREDARARLNEKRRLYAAYIASLQKGLETTIANYSYKVNGEEGTPEQRAASREYAAAMMTAVSTYFELALMAPKKVEELATQAMNELNQKSTGGGGNLFPRALSRMSDAMRADLGEPPLASNLSELIPKDINSGTSEPVPRAKP